ncbi:hypothetical protein BDZ89DRAFT_1254645, partial [Hymenopellis radicata]
MRSHPYSSKCSSLHCRHVCVVRCFRTIRCGVSTCSSRFGFPLFAPAMYNAFEYGEGVTALAVISITIGCPAPFLFWKYGQRSREKSRHSK